MARAHTPTNPLSIRGTRPRRKWLCVLKTGTKNFQSLFRPSSFMVIRQECACGRVAALQTTPGGLYLLGVTTSEIRIRRSLFELASMFFTILHPEFPNGD